MRNSCFYGRQDILHPALTHEAGPNGSPTFTQPVQLPCLGWPYTPDHGNRLMESLMSCKFIPPACSALTFPRAFLLFSCSVVSDSVTPWTVAHQAPLSMGFSRQEYWSGWPFPSPGDLPHQGIKTVSLALQADSLPSEPPGKPSNALGSQQRLPLPSIPKGHRGGGGVAGLLTLGRVVGGLLQA